MIIQQLQIMASGLAFLVLCFLGIFYVTSRFRRQDMDILRATNKDLRDAIDDKGKEIVDLRIEQVKMKDRITGLEHSNLTLEQLVTKALNQYFVNNPNAALELSRIN